jgi:hypothetical protein
MGRMSGDPKEKVEEDWLKTESKSTGLVFQPCIYVSWLHETGRPNLCHSAHVLIHARNDGDMTWTALRGYTRMTDAKCTAFFNDVSEIRCHYFGRARNIREGVHIEE